MMDVFDGLALSILAKATFVMAVGLVGAWVARGSRAAVRHAVLAAAFAVLLGLPVASMVVPPVRVAGNCGAGCFCGGCRRGSASWVFECACLLRVSSVSRWTWPPDGYVVACRMVRWRGVFLLRMMVGLWQVRSLRPIRSAWRDWAGSGRSFGAGC